MTNAHASSPQDAANLLRHVESVRSQTRSLLRAFWFPLVVFGAITLASALVQWAWPGAAVGLFWALAGPVGGVTVGRFYQSRQLRLGLSRPARPYILTAIGIFVGAFALPILTHGDLQEVVSTFAVAAGYLAFAWLERTGWLVLLALLMAAIPLVVLAAGVDHPGAVTAAATGAALVATGVLSRRGR
ncbi:MAG: hypothetical protein QOG43_917 [Actinomycetota bacterium]|jgi:hypothetical protein|nr:hypothetical protein [Actinomycetota bacterium]